jgi:hypothetical protein
MSEYRVAEWRDSEPTWIAIQEAVQEQRHIELAEIAVSLYGQLGEATAEISRLRATLRSCLAGLSDTARAGLSGSAAARVAPVGVPCGSRPLRR